MDISDKIINVCIIFAILAILSIIFGCFYFSNKSENFKDASKEHMIIEKITGMLTTATDNEITSFMNKNKALFTNQTFVKKIVETLKNEDFKTRGKKETFKAGLKKKPNKN
jgi:uncharacterized membrane protein affecting hemolysin expression